MPKLNLSNNEIFRILRLNSKIKRFINRKELNTTIISIIQLNRNGANTGIYYRQLSMHFIRSNNRTNYE